MPFFAHSNEEVFGFLREQSNAPLHITGGKSDHPGTETISLSKLDSVLLYEPEEMIISVQARITLRKLQEIIGAKNQWIPTLVAEESPELTLGAAVAMDHFHPRAKNLGMLRTTILGGTFCTTLGEIFKSGSRVVKSVAGYDIHRAFCGSRGMFGIILDLTLKIQPKPEMFNRFLAPLAAREEIVRFYPTCLEEFNGKLLVEFAGYKEDIESDIEQIQLDISVEKVSDEKWFEMIKLLRQKGSKTQVPVVEKLVDEVRMVFDPEGILV